MFACDVPEPDRCVPAFLQDCGLRRCCDVVTLAGPVKWVSFLLICCGTVAGCGGAPDSATKNRTFYDWSLAGRGTDALQLEKRYPPLDQPGTDHLPDYLGVIVLRDGIRISRPKSWIIREASSEPGRAYIQYIAPLAYAFNIYERPDSPLDLWRDVVTHYENDLQASGAKAVGSRVPFATFQGQGRAYSIERLVEVAKRPLVSHSREYLIRGEHRVVLVQVVHEGTDMSSIDHELMRVLTTLEVL